MVRVLLVGDVVGKVGRKMLDVYLRRVQSETGADLTIVNVENVAGGFGPTPQIWSEMQRLPVDVWTSGNHIWDKRDTLPLIDSEPRLLRPANYPAGNPGRGHCTVTTRSGVAVTVINLQGLTFMVPIESPFRVADRLLQELGTGPRVIVVDMHAEATSEKQALGWYLDGRVSAVIGTHTHVPTADETILPSGTALLTDVGMTGPYLGVIGFKPRPVLERFLYGTPRAFEPATDRGALCAVLMEIDESSGKARTIQRIRRDDEG